MMNFFNRILVVLQLLIAIALAPILIVVLLLYRQNVADTLTNLGRALTTGPNAALTQIICMALAALAFVIAILFLYLELQRPSVKRLKVQEVMGGQVEITSDAIVHRVEHAVSQIADVTKVRSHVVSTKKGNIVDLFLAVETNPNVNVPQKTQEVIGAARQVMEERMGLKVGKIEVRLDHSRKFKMTKGDGGQTVKPVERFEPPQQPQIPG